MSQRIESCACSRSFLWSRRSSIPRKHHRYGSISRNLQTFPCPSRDTLDPLCTDKDSKSTRQSRAAEDNFRTQLFLSCNQKPPAQYHLLATLRTSNPATHGHD